MDKADKPLSRTTLAYVVQHIPGGALLFAVGMLILLGYFGWFYYGAKHLDQAFYSLQLEKLSVTPQPPWIKSKVAEEVFNNGRLDRISLLEPRANAAIAQAFEMHNWVKSTTRVSKTVGGQVTVDVIYRQPAAMVFYEKRNSDGLSPDEVKSFFFPIDNEGMVLPTADFTSKDVWKHFMIFAQDARPAGDIGMPYGDVRITDALRLCELLSPYREQYQLQEIWVNHDGIAAGSSPWSLSIYTVDSKTRDKTREIVWGHAPGAENRGELPAEEKLNRMLAWLQQTPTSHSAEIPQIDLRYANSVTSVSTHQPATLYSPLAP